MRDHLLEVCPPEKECRPNVGQTPGPLMGISLHELQTLETPRVFLTPPAISHAQPRLSTYHESEVRARFVCNEPYSLFAPLPILEFHVDFLILGRYCTVDCNPAQAICTTKLP